MTNGLQQFCKRYQVPVGWRKGEALIIENRQYNGVNVWFAKRAKGFRIGDEIPYDAVYEQFFSSTEELCNFLDWWCRN